MGPQVSEIEDRRVIQVDLLCELGTVDQWGPDVSVRVGV